MEYFIFDNSALKFAYQADGESGGTELLNIYARMEKDKGKTLAITDAVLDEFEFRLEHADPKTRVRALKQWFTANGVKVLETNELKLVKAYRAGKNPDYNLNGGVNRLDDRGDRSILEFLEKQPNAGHTVFTDDAGFRGELRALSQRVKLPIEVRGNADMLNLALLDDRTPTRRPYINKERYVKYRKSYDTVLPNEVTKNPLLIDAELDAGKLPKRLGKTLAFAGTAFIVLDAMTTAAEAAAELNKGHPDRAPRPLRHSERVWRARPNLRNSAS